MLSLPQLCWMLYSHELLSAGQLGLELAKTGWQKDLIEKNKNNDRHNVIVFGVTKLHWHQNHH
jgi:hypothetical protein